MKNVDFNNEMIVEAAVLVIADGHSEDKAAKIWMKKITNTFLLGLIYLVLRLKISTEN